MVTHDQCSEGRGWEDYEMKAPNPFHSCFGVFLNVWLCSFHGWGEPIRDHLKSKMIFPRNISRETGERHRIPMGFLDWAGLILQQSWTLGFQTLIPRVHGWWEEGKKKLAAKSWGCRLLHLTYCSINNIAGIKITACKIQVWVPDWNERVILTGS